MRILITGANGFIGSHAVARLARDGHEIVAAVRDPESFRRRFPGSRAIAVDMNRDCAIEVWKERLQGIEAVANCAGALQSGRGQDLRAIHHRSPAALFDACAALGIRRVVQLSAISADAQAGTDYAETKLAGDACLMGLDLDWTILKPSLVYAEGAYGGTSLIRALAALPWVIPLPGRGDSSFQPIHVDDLAETIALCLREDRLVHRVIAPVGPEPLSLRDILERYRAWLGLPPARLLPVPLVLIRLVARIGDLFGAGPIRTTSVRQMLHGNTGDAAAFSEATGLHPRTLAAALTAHPAGVQDLWHARLYFFGPVLKALLAAFWIWSGIATLWNPPTELGRAVLGAIGLPFAWAPAAIVLGGGVDMALGIGLLVSRRPGRVGGLMLGVSAVYLLLLTIGSPGLWFDPLAALPKTLFVMLATVLFLIVGKER